MNTLPDLVRWFDEVGRAAQRLVASLGMAATVVAPAPDIVQLRDELERDRIRNARSLE